MVEVLYSDDSLIVIRKPSGLPVHRGRGDDAGAATALREARRLAGCRVYPVHRLDRATSGILIFALSPEAAGPLNLAFQHRVVAKSYLAVVRGVVPPEGIIDHPLSEEPDRLNGGVRGPERDAVTSYRRVADVELPVPVGRYASCRYSLVETSPLTGRRHQIRRHLKHLSHPVIGDTTYGDGRHNRFFRDRFGCGRLLLAAVEITFPHPVTGESITLTAPPDPSFLTVLESLSWTEALPHRWLPALGKGE
jgi:tRNA pseudouridine65 synthase